MQINTSNFGRDGRKGPAAPTAVLGPTNTGKTHYAIERMLARESGVIGLPLRLLAREVYDRIVAARGPGSAALITGEEKIIPPTARYWICTVEAMPVDRNVAFLAIDEIQLAADMERGRVFTSRLLQARGTQETLLLGSDTMRPILRNLFPDISFLSRERFSTLSYSGQKKVTRLPRRAAVVGFSSDTVYAIAELIRRQRGGAAVILGALSPRTRNAQAELYQSGEVDYLVATDAIGMGLNMDIDHVAFAARRKFDGRGARDLRNDELAQIAGRAGRHMRDGSFGVTSDCGPLDDETIEAIENHRFDPVRALQWRSEDLVFTSMDALTRSLAEPPKRAGLQRARPGEDELALARLSHYDEIRQMEPRGQALRLLWDVCQIPDFRKTALDQHARLLGDIYLQLAEDGRIKDDWLAPRVARLDRTDGDIDAISARIAHVRTWTYLSHRADWLENAPYWQEKARSIEDSLSDALHEKLTQRFVDRRTSVLLKKLKDDVPLLAGVTEDGEVIVEGQFIGRLLGFEFIVDPRASGKDAKRARAAAERALAPELAARAALLANAEADDLSLRGDGVVMWRSAPVARLEKGPAPLRPNLVLLGVDALSPHLRGRIYERVLTFVAARIEVLLSELIALNTAANAGEGGTLSALARGVAFRLVENFGAMSRSQFGDELKELNQEERAKLRNLGVRFGEFTLYMPKLLKPAPAKMLTLLWALWTDRDPQGFEPPKAGLVSLITNQEVPHAYYYAAGYRPSGARSVRIDMLERLAGQIRSARKDEYRGGFEASQQMMSLVGCSGEEFESILSSLGYRKQTLKVKAAAVAEVTPVEEAAAAPAETEELPEADVAEAEAPEAEAEAAPEAPVIEETPAAEAAPSEAASTDTSAEAATSTEERDVVVWRMAPRRPPRPKRPARETREARGAEARSGENQGERGPRRDRGRHEKRGENDGERRGGKPREARKDDRRDDRRGDRPHGKGGRPQDRRGPPPQRPQMLHAPQHRKVADPNSPFAVLLGLKEDLAKAQGGSNDTDKGETTR
ncbi:MAG: helicase-related protein [Parvularculaceae bacterium]